MRKSACLFVALVCPLFAPIAASAGGSDGGGAAGGGASGGRVAGSGLAVTASGSLNAGAEQTPWSTVQGRVSLADTSITGRHRLGDGGGGFNVDPSAGIDGFSVMGDYYFAHPFAASGGFRATSGLLVGPRSQALSIAQPNLAAGGFFSVDRRTLGQSTTLRGRGEAAGSDTTALPYIGLGYTARAARGALSVSADLGMVGRVFGSDSQNRPFAASLRSLDEPARDSRLLPVLQLGVLFSF